MSEPWESFAKGRGDPPGAGFSDWLPLNQLTHGTHLTAASRIAEDGQITGGLIYDGKLRKTRTEVVYFSPNTWGDGTRYGAFQFVVEWKRLLADRTLYWVESINTYKLPIYRFLLSRREVSSLGVRPYDPVADKGPIRRVDDDWFWAPGNVAEVVVDEALPITEVRSLAFAKHHDTYCSLKRTNCVEAGFGKSWRIHAAFLGLLLGRGIESLNEQLKEPDEKLSFEAQGAVSQLYLALVAAPDFESGSITTDKAARLVMRAACLMLHSGARTKAQKLVRLIDTEERAEKALLALIRNHLEVPEYEFS